MECFNVDIWFRTATIEYVWIKNWKRKRRAFNSPELSNETAVLWVRFDVLDEGLDIDLSREPFGVELRPFTSGKDKLEVRGDAAASGCGGRGLLLMEL
jgi:hypothetical protein